MILINNWGNDFLFALLDQKEQIEQFTNLASKHVQEWIKGGHDVKENIPTLIHMLLPEKASHSTKRARSPNPNEERDNEGRQSNDGTPEDYNKENRKRKPRGETNNLQQQQQQHFISPHNIQEIKIYNNSTDDDRGAGCPK